MSEAFASIRVQVPSRDVADRAVAEAFAAGASGLEEVESPTGGGCTLVVYGSAERAPAIREALRAALGASGRVGEAEAVARRDWTRAWRAGLEAVVVSPRLAVRPSFVEHLPAPGQRVLVVDPAQAFGTGHHPSTRLALQLLDALAPELLSAGRVLDVGTGSGVLALAAAALGAPRVVACDLDPVAARAAADNAAHNRLARRVGIFVGSVDALGAGGFDVVLANLLRRELAAVVPQLARWLAPGGAAIFSGLLEAEGGDTEARLGRLGLELAETRLLEDERGDRWIAMLSRRRPGRASDRAGGPGSR